MSLHDRMRPLIGPTISLFGMPHTGEPCPTCRAVAPLHILYEMVLPLPHGVYAPLSRHGYGPICHDCAAAESLVDMGILPGWKMARIATGNDRSESLRLPGVRFGLMAHGIVRPSHNGDLHALYEWQRQMFYPEEVTE